MSLTLFLPNPVLPLLETPSTAASSVAFHVHVTSPVLSGDYTLDSVGATFKRESRDKWLIFSFLVLGI